MIEGIGEVIAAQILTLIVLAFLAGGACFAGASYVYHHVRVSIHFHSPSPASPQEDAK